MNFQELLNSLAQSVGQGVNDYVTSRGYATVAELEARFNEVSSQIEAITKIDEGDGVETLAEKIAKINEVVSNEDGVVQQIFDLIVQNETAISEETQRATQAEADILTEAKEYADTVSANVADVDVCQAVNKFREALGLDLYDCSNGGDGDGATL